jgi:hypothetical protein
VEEVLELTAEDLAQPGHVLPALKVRLASDDGHHAHVARVVGGGQGLDGLVELLVGLGVGGDQRHVPDLPRVRDRLAASDQTLELALLIDQPAQLAAPAGGRGLISRPAQLGGSQGDRGHQAGQAGQAGLRIGQGEGPLAPVDGHHPAQPPERDQDADRQHGRPVEPEAVEGQHKDADDPREAERERYRTQDDQPGDDAGHHLQQTDPPRPAGLGLRRRPGCRTLRQPGRGVLRG